MASSSSALDDADRVRYHDAVAGETMTQAEVEDALRQKVAALEAALAAKTSELAKVTAERNKLRRAYELLKGQLELLRRRIFVAKAERIDTSQLEIEFAETKAKLDQLARVLDDPSGALGAAGANGAQIGRLTLRLYFA